MIRLQWCSGVSISRSGGRSAPKQTVPPLPLIAADPAQANETGARDENGNSGHGVEGVGDGRGLGDSFEGGELGREGEEEG
jgi:hypothetical protein